MSQKPRWPANPRVDPEDRYLTTLEGDYDIYYDPGDSYIVVVWGDQNLMALNSYPSAFVRRAKNISLPKHVIDFVMAMVAMRSS
jgi:hypothetical protein